MTNDPPDCSELEQTIGLCRTDAKLPPIQSNFHVWHSDDFQCFNPTDSPNLHARKITIFVIYAILLGIIGIIVFPTIHEFGHLLFSGLEGRMVWDLTNLNNIRIYAIVNHWTFMTAIGGVLTELLAASLFGWIATRRRSFTFGILAIFLVVSPIVYCILYLINSPLCPFNNDFQNFLGYHWGLYILFVTIALIIVIRMIIVNLRITFSRQTTCIY